MHDNRLLWAILAGAAAGVVCGWFFGRATLSLSWLGDLFLDALKMTIIPLIAASVISGVTALGDIRKLGRLGGFSVLYFLLTTGLAVLLGLVSVNLLEPGSGVAGTVDAVGENDYSRKQAGFSDIIRSLVSPNLIAAAADTQLLPIIVFCVLLGCALTTVGERGHALTQFFDGLNDVMMKLVIWIMYFAPIGIFALVAARLGRAGGGPEFWRELSSVGLYIVAVAGGLVIHFGVLFGILVLLAGRGRTYLVSLLRALVTAFGTASSTATLPLTLECAIEAGVDRRAAKFVLPLGATVNMNGTALYEAVAVMFIAQAYGIDMSFTQQAIIFITATLAAIGAAGIPEAGLVTMVIVLTAVDLPTEGIGLLLAVDWFLDRLRTTVNVWGDCVGAAVVERFALEPHVQSAVEAAEEVR